MKTEEEKVNDKLKESFDKYLRQVGRMQNGLISEVDGTRLEFNDVVDKFADINGIVDKRKLKKLLSDFEALFDYVDETMIKEMEVIIEDTANRAIRDVLAAMGLLAVGMYGSKKLITEDVMNDVFDDVGKDGKTLRDRVKQYSGDLIDDLRKTMRDMAYKGKSTSQINKALKDAIEKQNWKLRRIVATVSPGVYRRVVASLAKKGKHVKAVRIIDRRGRHKNHEDHECYRLAEQDMYGWGKGVYRPEDEFIYDPHPNCTAYYELVLNTEIDEEGN